MRRLLCLLILAAAARAADDVRLTAGERRAETEWLTSLGLKVPEGGLLLEAPFSPPYTRRSFLVPTALALAEAFAPFAELAK